MKLNPGNVGKNIELAFKDNVGSPEGKDVGGAVRTITGNIATKVHRVLSRPFNAIVSGFEETEYELRPREGALSETVAGVREALNTQVFTKGPLRLLNLPVKAAKAVVNATDVVIRDGIQVLGGGQKGDGYTLQPTGSA